MKEPVAPDAATVEAIRARLKLARTIAEFQRIECVLMRATTDCSTSQMAQALGWATATVHVTHSRRARQGEAIFELKGKGGRRSHHLTEQEEAEVLAPFVEQATAGNVLKAADIQAAYEARVGRAVPDSTIYRLLKRHGWRKLAPRPRHPKADVAARGAFKKSPPARAPYSAELNSAEHLWDSLRENHFGNTVSRDPDAVKWRWPRGRAAWKQIYRVSRS